MVGTPAPHPLQGIGAGFIPKNLKKELLDGVIQVEGEPAFEYARRSAAEEGLLVGISSGATLAAIAQKLHVSKSTLYSYLRHRDVQISPYEKSEQRRSESPATASVKTNEPKVATILLSLRIQNNSKFVRGKKRTIEHIESFYLAEYDAQRRPNGDYELNIPYDSGEDLDNTVNELLNDIASDADDRNCFSESDACMEGASRHWS